jgi:hypothetical protein
VSAPPPARAPLRPRDWLRLAFVAAHVWAVAIPAIPSPPSRLSVEELSKRGAKRTLAAWRGMLAAAGVELSHEQAARGVARVANRAIAARNLLSKPMEPYRRLSGARQSWRMFSQVSDRTARLEVWERRNGVLEPLYIALDPAHQWRGRTLRAERMRAYTNLFVSKTGRPSYVALVEWLACLRKAEPEAGEGMRVQMQRLQIPSPAVLAETGALVVDQPYWPEERSYAALDCAARAGAPADDPGEEE